MVGLLACGWGCAPKAEKQFGESNRAFLERYLAQDDGDFQFQAMMKVARSWDGRADWAQERFRDSLQNAVYAEVRLAALTGVLRSDAVPVELLQERLFADASVMVRRVTVQRLEELAGSGRISAEQIEGLARAILAADADEDVGVQAQRLRLLGYSRNPDALLPLVAQVRQEQPERLAIGFAAQASLLRMTGQGYQSDQGGWLAWLEGTDSPFAQAGMVPAELRKADRPWWLQIARQYLIRRVEPEDREDWWQL